MVGCELGQEISDLGPGDDLTSVPGQAPSRVDRQRGDDPAFPRADRDQPITVLHRTQGSFGEEAKASAPLIPGELARIGIVVAGAAFFYALGAKMGRRGRQRRREG